MGSLTIELPDQHVQTGFNIARWQEIVADPELQTIEGRIETDRYGHIVMSPPPAANHGFYQGEIYYLLRSLLRTGRVCTECPISTADGVRAADVAWASPECLKKLGNHPCFPAAPEICVEVVSPSNKVDEIRDKMALYFNAGAQEVWLCSPKGEMTFFTSPSTQVGKSFLCSKFPKKVVLAG